MARPTSKVEIVRLTYGHYVITAFDLFGRVVAERGSPRFGCESKRRAWAVAQAEQWAERFGLWLDPKVYF